MPGDERRPTHHPCFLVAAHPIDLVVVATFSRLKAATTTKSINQDGIWIQARDLDTGAGTPSTSTSTRQPHYSEASTSRMSFAVSLGVLPTLTPAASRASFLPWAVPAPEETMAPAWPIVLPSGAVNPAT